MSGRAGRWSEGLAIGLLINVLTPVVMAIPLKLLLHLQWRSIITDCLAAASILFFVIFGYWLICEYVTDRTEESLRRRWRAAGRSRREINAEINRRRRAHWWVL